jgi:hypothetical protein
VAHHDDGAHSSSNPCGNIAGNLGPRARGSCSGGNTGIHRSRSTNDNDTMNILSRLRSLDARFTSNLDHIRTVPGGQNGWLRHVHDEFTSIRNEGVAVINQLQGAIAQQAANNASMRGVQHGVGGLSERVAAMDMRLADADAGKFV